MQYGLVSFRSAILTFIPSEMTSIGVTHTSLAAFQARGNPNFFQHKPFSPAEFSIHRSIYHEQGVLRSKGGIGDDKNPTFLSKAKLDELADLQSFRSVLLFFLKRVESTVEAGDQPVQTGSSIDYSLGSIQDTFVDDFPVCIQNLCFYLLLAGYAQLLGKPEESHFGSAQR